MVDRGSPHTVTAQIAAALREAIDTGELRPGDAVPSEVHLAQRYGVSRGTARSAVAALRAEGRVRTHFGRGTFVAEPSDRRPIVLAPGDAVTVVGSPGGPVVRVRTGDTVAVHPAYEVELRVPGGGEPDMPREGA